MRRGDTAERKCRKKKMIDYAVIDIGSNSVRLMTIADGIVLYKTVDSTRLGEGLASSKTLKEEAIKRTSSAVANFHRKAKKEGAKKVFAYATAAVRSAENGQAFVKEVKELCGLDVETVSGEEEARLGISGALGECDGAVVDVGGASTELVVQKEGKIIYAKSIDIGVVRLKDVCGRDLEKLTEACKEAVRAFQDAKIDCPLYGIGGTATSLAAMCAKIECYDPEKVTGVTFGTKKIRTLACQLAEMSVEEIAALPCITQKRAEVLGGGAVLLAALTEELGVSELIVSDGDNLEGYAKSKGLLK